MNPQNLFEYYKSKNQALPSVQERAPIYEQSGLGKASDYTGSLQQNDALLGYFNKQITTPTTNTGGSTYTQGTGVEDFTSGISTTSTPSTPIVGTSDADRIKAIRDSLGTSPTVAVTSEADKAKLTTAQNERNAINTEMESILAERLKLTEEMKVFKQTSGEGVSEAGRIGMESEKGRALQNQLDSLNNRESVLETKLNNRNSVIKELMDTNRQNYTDAVNNYNTKFTQALQLYTLLDKEDDELKTNAKASLDVLSNTYKAQIEAGKLKIDSLTGVQKSKLNEYELQAGLPQGSTLAMLSTMKPGEEKLYSGVDDAGNFNMITKNPDGSLNYKRIAEVATKKGVINGTDGVPKGLLNQQQISRLGVVGIDSALAVAITTDILSGMSLDDIRKDLRAGGKDAALLDRYDSVVGIASLLKTQKTKKGGSSTDMTDEEFLNFLNSSGNQ